MFTCINIGEKTLVEKKSRFIASSHSVSCRDDVKRIVDELWKQHPDARHICYGYIADEAGDDFGYYDDGEPNGTAGKPIYSAVAASGARRSMIAVVRYFGGIKLGAGGLTRAYRQAASELIESVGLISAERQDEYEICCDNETYKKICVLLRKSLCKIDRIMYTDKVSFTTSVPSGIDIFELVEPLNIEIKHIGTKTVTVS